MAEPYLCQIIWTSFNFAPRGYALCNGQLLPINQNQALFTLIGTQFGGDGSTTFALPDLRGRGAMGAQPSADPKWRPTPYPIGTKQGVENVTLTANQIPAHNHPFFASSQPATDAYPGPGEALAVASASIYGAPTSLVQLGGGPSSPTGADPHANMQPYLTMNACIAITGVFPPRN